MTRQDFSIDKVIKVLKGEEQIKGAIQRPIFTSEADFQLALAQTIKACYPETTVRLEYCPENITDPNTNGDMHIDILVLWERQWIPIELKYKTKEFRYIDDDGCLYNLKTQSAYNLGCYDYWRDVNRIEKIASQIGNQYKTGFAIFLTNDPVYFEHRERYDNNDTAQYSIFRIFNEREVGPGSLSWPAGTSISDSRSNEIDLSGNYSLNWIDYSTPTTVDGQQTSFQILKSEISL